MNIESSVGACRTMLEFVCRYYGVDVVYDELFDLAVALAWSATLSEDSGSPSDKPVTTRPGMMKTNVRWLHKLTVSHYGKVVPFIESGATARFCKVCSLVEKLLFGNL